MRQRSGRHPFLQSTGSPGSITPPTVGATAHDVRPIDDEHLHTESVGNSFNPARPCAHPRHRGVALTTTPHELRRAEPYAGPEPLAADGSPDCGSNLLAFSARCERCLRIRQRFEHDHRYLSGRGAAMVLLPPRILLETTVDIALPLLPLQLTGPHRDCRSFPGDHHARMCAQVVIPTGISGQTIVEAITTRRSPSGRPSTGSVRGCPVRAPVVVNITIGSPETHADKVVRLRLSRKKARSIRGRARAGTNDIGTTAAAFWMRRRNGPGLCCWKLIMPPPLFGTTALEGS